MIINKYNIKHYDHSKLFGHYYKLSDGWMIDILTFTIIYSRIGWAKRKFK